MKSVALKPQGPSLEQTSATPLPNFLHLALHSLS